jgi:hypothetical protein
MIALWHFACFGQRVSQFKGCLQGSCLYINAHFDAESLCKALPKRLQQIIDAEGGDPGSVHWAPEAEEPRP